MVDARQAHDRAEPGDCVIGWKLDRDERTALLKRFPPRYAETVADHVTLKAKVAKDSSLPDEDFGEIVGRADDGAGVEAMIVRIGEETDRPDGSTYHVTWSLDEGREAVESNQVIADTRWESVDPPIRVSLKPDRF
jgi:hypothetical protein